MMLKKRALLLMLAFWLPLQGLAGTLLYCDNSPADAVSGELTSLHQSHTPPVAEVAHEQTGSAECGSHHLNSGPDSLSPDNCDHCQQCCQMSATLILSPSPLDNFSSNTLETWPSENADSIIPEPLFHPPQDLS